MAVLSFFDFEMAGNSISDPAALSKGKSGFFRRVCRRCLPRCGIFWYLKTGNLGIKRTLKEENV